MKTRIALRVLAFPFVSGVILTSYIFHAIRNSTMFLINGGEWITYGMRHERKTIQDIYFLLSNQQNKATTKKGEQLEFISQIKRDGSGTVSVDKDYIKMMSDDDFYISCLSMTNKTYIANGFNAFIVKIK